MDCKLKEQLYELLNIFHQLQECSQQEFRFLEDHQKQKPKYFGDYSTSNKNGLLPFFTTIWPLHQINDWMDKINSRTIKTIRQLNTNNLFSLNKNNLKATAKNICQANTPTPPPYWVRLKQSQQSKRL